MIYQKEFPIINPNGYQIDVATWRDVRAFYDLERICFPIDAWPVWDVVAVLTFPNIVRYKAIYDNKIVGFIIGDRRVRQNTGWIATFGVLPQHRQRGIGTALLTICEQSLALPKIRLSVRSSNEKAIRLYKRNGYQAVGSWAKYYKGGEDALIMEKIIE